jgi:hypothetical protein
VAARRRWSDRIERVETFDTALLPQAHRDIALRIVPVGDGSVPTISRCQAMLDATEVMEIAAAAHGAVADPRALLGD